MAAIPMIQTELHQQILDNLSEAVALFGADLRLRYLNPAAEMLFGGSARQLLGMPFDDLVMPHEPVIEQLREAVESHHPFSKHEQIIDLYNNKQITADFTVTVLHSSFGESELLFEIKPIDRLLRITREDALMAQQVATRDLLRGLAHEIKNPLGGLRGAAQLLERELHSEEQKEYTRVIIDEADRLQKLVNRLLGPSGMPNPAGPARRPGYDGRLRGSRHGPRYREADRRPSSGRYTGALPSRGNSLYRMFPPAALIRMSIRSCSLRTCRQVFRILSISNASI
ncbi:MAG: histidine kinase dimerization/phospho-acceptor domain-containing protein [Gammaproteobacteria bacterium]